MDNQDLTAMVAKHHHRLGNIPVKKATVKILKHLATRMVVQPDPDRAQTAKDHNKARLQLTSYISRSSEFYS